MSPRARHAVAAFSGSRLRDLRREQHLSQEQLARRLVAAAEQPATDVTKAVTRERLKIVAYEQGSRRPRADALHGLAAALDVTPHALLDPAAPVTVELLRALQNLTQGQIAGQLGLSQARYSQLENGQGSLDSARLARLAGLLQVPAADLARIVPTSAQESP